MNPARRFATTAKKSTRVFIGDVLTTSDALARLRAPERIQIEFTEGRNGHKLIYQQFRRNEGHRNEGDATHYNGYRYSAKDEKFHQDEMYSAEIEPETEGGPLLRVFNNKEEVWDSSNPDRWSAAFMISEREETLIFRVNKVIQFLISFSLPMFFVDCIHSLLAYKTRVNVFCMCDDH